MAAPASMTLAQAVARSPAPASRLLAWGAVAGGLIAWTVLAVGSRAGDLRPLGGASDLLVLGVPAAALMVVVLSRPHSSPQAKVVLAWTAAFAVALESPEIVGDDPLNALAPAVVALAGAAALRWPMPTLVFALFLSGTYNTIRLYTPVETGPTMDLALLGAWVALVYAWAVGRQRLPAATSPAFALAGLYLAATLLQTVLAEELQRSLFAFRGSAWLMTLVFLVPLWANTPERRRVLHKAALVVGAVVGGYAMLRWAIGPGEKERVRVVEAAGGYSTNDLGEVKLLGSLPSAQTLALWSSAMLAFALASALSPIGAGWRALAAIVTVMSGLSIFGADIRFGMVAGIAGVLVVLTLFAVGKGFAGRRALPLALVIVLGAVGGGLFVTTKLSSEGSSGERFRNLVTDPIADNSVQQRFIKWRTLLAEVDNKPFGMGVGASGAAETKYARFTTAASFNPDSSYIKIAYDQGFFVLILFAAVLVALLVALALAAVTLTNPGAAAAAMGGCGSLAAFAVIMSGGIHYEGLVAAGPWIMIGIGAAGLVSYVQGTAEPPPRQPPSR